MTYVSETNMLQHNYLELGSSKQPSSSSQTDQNSALENIRMMKRQAEIEKLELEFELAQAE